MDRIFIFLAQVKANVDSLPRVNADSAELQKILSIVFSIMGGIAVLIIVLSGLRVMIAKDDPQAVAQSRMAILYAIIGLFVSASAFTIVNVVLKGL